MHSLTGGRFTLGLGRGIDPLFDATGLPHITTAQIEDFAGLMRRLWKGEVILGHDGPAGSLPVPQPRRRRWTTTSRSVSSRSAPTRSSSAGARFDEVVLHTFFTDETDRPLRCDGQGRGRGGRARSRRGEDVVVLRDDRRPHRPRPPAQEDRRAPGHLPPGLRRSARATNGWDPAVLERFRADEVVVGVPGAIDAKADDRGARARRHAHPRRVARAHGDGHAEQCAAAVRASSISGATA